VKTIDAAGLNLLRRERGTQIWIPENSAPILHQPSRYNLPCLWFDSVAPGSVTGAISTHPHRPKGGSVSPACGFRLPRI